MNTNLTKLFITLFLSAMTVSCDNSEQGNHINKKDVAETTTETSNNNQNKPENLTEEQEIDYQIKRIEAKLQSEPTVKGWLLVGDANMHLKRYEKAASAYKEAYILSDYSNETREKLKRAMYYVGLDKNNVTQ